MHVPTYEKVLRTNTCNPVYEYVKPKRMPESKHVQVAPFSCCAIFSVLQKFLFLCLSLPLPLSHHLAVSPILMSPSPLFLFSLSLSLVLPLAFFFSLNRSLSPSFPIPLSLSIYPSSLPPPTPPSRSTAIERHSKTLSTKMEGHFEGVIGPQLQSGAQQASQV